MKGKKRKEDALRSSSSSLVGPRRRSQIKLSSVAILEHMYSSAAVLWQWWYVGAVHTLTQSVSNLSSSSLSLSHTHSSTVFGQLTRSIASSATKLQQRQEQQQEACVLFAFSHFSLSFSISLPLLSVSCPTAQKEEEED